MVEVRKLKTTTEQVVFLGAAACGKTTIVKYYMCEEGRNFVPRSNQMATTGLNCARKSVTTKTGLKNVKLWDTAGQERF